MKMLHDPCTLHHHHRHHRHNSTGTMHIDVEGFGFDSGVVATAMAGVDYHRIAPFFDWGRSTEFNYSRKQQQQEPESGERSSRSFVGHFASIRANLDYTYHGVYTESRQLLQDSILESLLNRHHRICRGRQDDDSEKKQWIVFTAGSMGVGKTWTLQVLDQEGYFPLSQFLRVDPDEIRYQLPEYKLYHPTVAGEQTQKEAGYMAEVLMHAALERGWNVLVDGSLRNAEWYMAHFQALRQQYDNAPLSLAILHVTAPTELIYQRVQHRAATPTTVTNTTTTTTQMGRVVPLTLLEQVMDQVPQAVGKLKLCVDFFAELHNPGDQQGLQLSTPGLTWKMFQQQWQPQNQHQQQRGHLS